MEKYKYDHIRFGIGENETPAPRVGEVALRVNSSGQIFTRVHGSQSETPVGGGGEVGPSPYDNHYIIDPSGNGDYTTFTDAVVDNSPPYITHTHFWVIGDTTEGNLLHATLSGNFSIHVLPGVTLDMLTRRITVSDGNIFIGGGGKITSISDFSTIHIANDANTNVTFDNIHIDCQSGSSDPAILFSTLDANMDSLVMRNTKTTGTGVVVWPANYTNALFVNCDFGEQQLAGSAWDNAPFYYCLFGVAPINITPDTGTAIGTCTVPT